MAAKKQMTDTDLLHEEQVCIDLDGTHDHGLPVPAQANEPRPVQALTADDVKTRMKADRRARPIQQLANAEAEFRPVSSLGQTFEPCNKATG